MIQPFCETAIAFISRDELLKLPERLAAHNVLFLATQSAVTRFSLEPLLGILRERYDVRWYSECATNPSPQDIYRCLSAIGGFAPDCIIALGGGSVIDMAKAIAALSGLADDAVLSIEIIVRAISEKVYLKVQRFPDIIAIPTTAGTGSELTSWATVWDRDNNVKYSIDAAGLKPKQALMCPALTQTLSALLTLSTGLDSVSHALEAYWSKRTTPLVQELSKQSLTLSVKYLKRSLQTPDDCIGRNYLLRASTLSALAFSQTRTTACHSISYPLTLLFEVEHGLAAAMTLGEVFNFNRRALDNPLEIDEIFADFNGVQGWVDYVCEGIVRLRLSTFGISPDDVGTIAANAFTAGRMDNNPVDLDEKDVVRILYGVLGT